LNGKDDGRGVVGHAVGHAIYSQVAMLLPPRSEAPEIMTDLNDRPGRTARGVGWQVNNTNDQRKKNSGKGHREIFHSRTERIKALRAIVPTPMIHGAQ
jgi:hypothetical protein